MLETIKSDKLLHLDISNNIMNPNHQERLMKFLLSHKELKTLNVESELNSKYQFPKITENILELVNLESVKFTKTVKIDYILKKLGQVEGCLNLKTLELFDSLNKDQFSFFCEKFDKLSNLTYLGIGIVDSDIETLTNNIEQLKNLKEIVFDFTLDSDSIGKLVSKLLELKMQTKISSKIGMFIPELASNMCFLQNVSISSYNKNSLFSSMKTDLNFEVSKLEFNPGNISDSDFPEASILFEKFTKLKSLSLWNQGNINWSILEKLLENNFIEEFELTINSEFSQFKALSNIVKDCRFKKLTIGGWAPFESLEEFKFFLKEPKFWAELEELELNLFGSELIICFLENVKLPKLRTLTLRIRTLFPNDFNIAQLTSVKTLSIEIYAYFSKHHQLI